MVYIPALIASPLFGILIGASLPEEEAPPPRPLSLQAKEDMLEKALALKREGKTKEAKGILLQVLKREPYNPKAHHLLGWVLRELGENEGAFRHLRAASYLAPPGSPSVKMDLEAARRILLSLPELRRRKLSLEPPVPIPPPPKEAIRAKVKRVWDGDTFEALVGGREEKIRLIGVNTPEMYRPFGPEAKKFTEGLIKGKTVLLSFDVQKRDRYGRLLCYVWLPEGGFLNAEIVHRGYGGVMTIPPNVTHAPLFLALQREAKEREKGLWALGAGKPRATPPPGYLYLGNKRTKVFHHPWCKWAKRISSRNRVYFRAKGEAMEAGHRPCKVCRP